MGRALGGSPGRCRRAFLGSDGGVPGEARGERSPSIVSGDLSDVVFEEFGLGGFVGFVDGVTRVRGGWAGAGLGQGVALVLEDGADAASAQDGGDVAHAATAVGAGQDI